MKNKVIAALLLVVLLIFGLRLLAAHPVVSYKTEVPKAYCRAIEGQAKGVYSEKLPLVPVYVSVDSFVGREVSYTIYYFPFGTVGMEYIEGEGFSVCKPLTGF